MTDPRILLIHNLPGGRAGHETEAPDPETGVRAVHIVTNERELDRLRQGRWISQYQFDAGNRLRDIWEQADVRQDVRAMNMEAGAGLFGGERGEVGNAEAFAEYLRLIRIPHIADRGFVQAVCIFDQELRAYARGIRVHFGYAMQRLQRGLGKLARELAR